MQNMFLKINSTGASDVREMLKVPVVDLDLF